VLHSGRRDNILRKKEFLPVKIPVQISFHLVLLPSRVRGGLFGTFVLPFLFFLFLSVLSQCSRILISGKHSDFSDFLCENSLFFLKDISIFVLSNLKFSTENLKFFLKKRIRLGHLAMTDMERSNFFWSGENTNTSRIFPSSSSFFEKFFLGTMSFL
jgi:hypothetical protein